MKDYVIFYGPTDGAPGYELRNAEKVIQSFNADTEYTDINNGPELRNKYAHGIFPVDPKKQEHDYIELLRIMVLIIIKINEEFCIMNPN